MRAITYPGAVVDSTDFIYISWDLPHTQVLQVTLQPLYIMRAESHHIPMCCGGLHSLYKSWGPPPHTQVLWRTPQPLYIMRAATYPWRCCRWSRWDIEWPEIWRRRQVGGWYFCLPLVVETFGINSLRILKTIASITCSLNPTTPAKAMINLIQLLSTCLWAYNCQMIPTSMLAKGLEWDLYLLK